MLSRALSLATVTLLVGCLTSGALLAVENLEAGKTPSQIFSGTCNACHKSPRGLLKTVAPGSLPGFLRQHYTTSSDMASLLSSFLISNGATDTRFQGKDQAKTDAAKGAKQQQEAARPDQLDRWGRRQNPAPSAQEASRPDDGITPQDGRTGRDGKRRPGQTQEAARPADGTAPLQAATDSKTGAKQKHGKRGKPEEPPKSDETAKDESSTTAKVDSKDDVAKPEAAKPAGEGTSDSTSPEPKSETARVDGTRESVGGEPTPLRPDPVPPVTPAPPPGSAATGNTPEPATSPSISAAAPAPPEVTASAPPPPPVAPAGPPAPPISQ